MYNNVHAVKKPRLDIEKQVNSQCTKSVDGPSKKSNCGDDFYHTQWGDDFDVKELEQVDLDESSALSQMPIESVVNPATNMGSIGSMWGPFNPSLTSNHFTLDSKRSTFKPNLNQELSSSIRQSNTSNGVPLRRTASSDSHSSRQLPYSLTDNSGKGQPSSKSNCRKRTGFHEIGSAEITLLTQLQKDLKKLQDELNTKNGEVNLLRTKQLNAQKEFNKKKNEYIGAIKQETEKNACLLKENQSLKTQLDVKKMELETAEKKMAITKRLPQDSPSNRSPRRFKRGSDVKNNLTPLGCKTYSLAFELLQQLIKPHLLEPTQPQVSIVEAVWTLKNPGLFSGTDQTRPIPNEAMSSSKSLYLTALTHLPASETKRVQLDEPFCSLERCALALFTPTLLASSSQQALTIIKQVLDDCQKILRNQLSQLICAAAPLKKHLEREREVQHSSKKLLMLSDECNLLSSKELFNNERGISSRRALGLISLLVAVSNHAVICLVESLNTDPNKVRGGTVNDSNPITSTVSSKCNILTILKDVVDQIETQRRTIMFEGVLAAAMSLVKNVLQADFQLSQNCQEVFVDIMRSVVFARPGSLVLYLTLEALISATKYPFIMDSICKNSAEKTFIEQNSRYSTVTYFKESCILQVLCILLYSAETPRKHALSLLFTSWVLILFYGGNRNPNWLYSVPSQTTCKCRSLISRLSFNLLGEAICEYQSVPDDTSSKKTLQRLLTRGVLMVSTLLYHDEHFGANIDPPSVGFYELFLYSLNSSDIDIDLIRPCRVILEMLWKQESHRQPMNDLEGNIDELNRLLIASNINTSRSINPGNVLEHLDSL